MKIINKKILSQDDQVRVTQFEIEAPLIANQACAGQFVVLIVNEQGERFPLTIVNKDEKEGTITIIAQEVGLATKLLGRLGVGDSLYALVGPLGHPTEIKDYKKVILIGGGVGIAEIFPIAKALKEAGNYVISIIGAKTKELLILEEELKQLSDELHITTDDGTYGQKGFTTDILKELLADSEQLKNYGLVFTVGPIPMMQKVAQTTEGFGVKTVASLNALMVDATGMCGCCRVTIDNKVKFSCVDGPEFDAHLVDWAELSSRSRIYADKEKHICKLKLENE